MKKRVFFAILIVVAAGAFAQSRDRQDREGRRQPPPAVTVTGTLSLIDGRIALENDEAAYYAAGLGNLAGFVDGLKEGAAVTLEGFARPLLRRDGAEKERQLLRVTALTINGRRYDLSAPAVADAGSFSGHGFPMPGHRMMMMNRNSRRHFRDMPGPRMWNRGPGGYGRGWN
ncbi:MAG: hypothetical protein LBJ24_02415 [Treponema sp.]|jgi:hypothetical protein|nr:hypothetical protein [Treponema sp.]